MRVNGVRMRTLRLEEHNGSGESKGCQVLLRHVLNRKKAKSPGFGNGCTLVLVSHTSNKIAGPNAFLPTLLLLELLPWLPMPSHPLPYNM